MENFSADYLLNRRVKIFQPLDGYRASIDAVLLASLVKNLQTGETILDIGSGTGAVALCLAARFAGMEPEITGIELQENLVFLSNMSAKENGYAKVKFINGDIRTPSPELRSTMAQCFSHVLSNPPYAFNDMPSPNQSKAAAHNLKNMRLSDWLDICIKRVKPKGWFYTVNRAEALPEILHYFYGRLGNIKIIPVCSYEGEKAHRILAMGQKNSKPPAEILPPLILHTHDKSYSPTAEKILRNAQSLF